MRFRILVTDAHSRKALAVVRALAGEWDVWTVSGSRVSVAGWSRYSRRHLAHPGGEGFAEWLLEFSRQNGVDTIVCPEEDTIIRVARLYDSFVDAGIHLSFPRIEVLDRAFDKARTLAAAAATGVPAPPTVNLDDLGDAEAAAAAIGYPIVIKARHSYYWNGREFTVNKGPAYARNVGQLRAHLEQWDQSQPPPMLQAFVPGRGEGVSLLVRPDGTCVAAFAHRRVRDIHPSGSASVVRTSIALDAGMRNAALNLLREMGLWGVAMVEFRIDERTNQPVLMEVNARLWGSLQLAVDAGVNFPGLLVDVARGRPAQGPSRYREGVTVRWWLGDLRRTLRVLRRRPPTGYPEEYPPRGEAIRDFLLGRPRGSRNEVFRRHDPLPAVGELLWALRHVR